MSDDTEYERWLQSHGVGTVQADLRNRLPNTVNLYLDDVRPCPVGWTVARSVKEAIAVMEGYMVTEASLDHDLGACSECIDNVPDAAVGLHCPHVPDGQEFVRWMTATGVWPSVKPRVHSMNAKGAAIMRSMIDKDWKPQNT